MATAFTLDEAKQAVLRAVESVVDDEHKISEADGADLAHAVRGFAHLFDLDEWVLNQPLLKRRFCRFPLCFNPPRSPRTDDGGRSRGGNPPAYCEHGLDEEGMPHDNAQRAKRRREQLRAQRDQERRAVLSGELPGDERQTNDSRPVTQSRDLLLTKLDGVQASLDRLVEIARRGADDASRLAEIEAIENAASQRVEAEKGRRIEAELGERKARAEAARMADDLVEANAAAAGEAEDARQAREELAEVRAELAEVRADAAQQLARTTTEAAAQVEAAVTARDNAVAEAERRIHEAQVEVSAANQATADAQAERDDAKTEARRLAAVVDELRAAALNREREFEAETAKLRAEHDKQRAGMQAAIDQLRERHDTDMRELRERLEEQATQRVAAAETAAAKLHAAELAAATATADAQRTRAERAEEDLLRLRSADEG